VAKTRLPLMVPSSGEVQPDHGNTSYLCDSDEARRPPPVQHNQPRMERAKRHVLVDGQDVGPICCVRAVNKHNLVPLWRRIHHGL
jgi:hypothetical protein